MHEQKKLTKTVWYLKKYKNALYLYVHVQNRKTF